MPWYVGAVREGVQGVANLASVILETGKGGDLPVRCDSSSGNSPGDRIDVVPTIRAGKQGAVSGG